MLLEFDEIQRRLHAQFLPLEPMTNGFRLVNGSMSSAHIAQCERVLGIIFPMTFKRPILRYDFGNLTIGPTVFCNSGNYIHCLIRANTKSDYAWWGLGARPSDLVMVANAEFTAVLLDTKDKRVVGFPHAGKWQDTIFQLATDFETLVRGIATVFLKRQTVTEKEDLALEVASNVGGEDAKPFWIGLAR
jgi:hypothetical protein